MFIFTNRLSKHTTNMATDKTAESPEKTPFNTVYPFDALLAPVNKGALLVTSPPTNSLTPPVGSFNPVYPYGFNRQSLANGKLVVTGAASDFLTVKKGLNLTNNTLSLTPELTAFTNVSNPLTLKDESLHLLTKAPLQIMPEGLDLRLGAGVQTNENGELDLRATAPLHVSSEGLSLNLGPGLQVLNQSLNLNLDQTLSVSDNRLRLARYCFGWTGVGYSQEFTSQRKNAYTAYPVLALERLGELVHGFFSVICVDFVNANDPVSVSFNFTTLGKLASSSSYSGPWGGRGASNSVSQSPDLSLLLPTSEYQEAINAFQSFTVPVRSGNETLQGNVSLLIKTDVPSDATAGLEFTFSLPKPADAPGWGPIYFTYLSK